MEKRMYQGTVYSVVRKADNVTLDIFTTREIAEQSIEITYKKCPERMGEVEIKEISLPTLIKDYVDHL